MSCAFRAMTICQTAFWFWGRYFFVERMSLLFGTEDAHSAFHLNNSDFQLLVLFFYIWCYNGGQNNGGRKQASERRKSTTIRR